MTNQRIAEIVKEHTDAFLIQMLGVAGSGLTPERIQYLRDRGVLLPSDEITADQTDPLSVVQRMGVFLNDRLPTDPEYRESLESVAQRSKDSTWGTEAYTRAGQAVADVAEQSDAQEAARVADVNPSRPGGLSLPDVPVTAEAAPRSSPDKPGWVAAVDSIGSFIRGLGNVWSDTLQDAIGEEWDGESVITVPDPDEREKMIGKIRQTILDAKEKGRTVQQVARDLANNTKDFTRNWRRIAETEMQALYNQTAANYAIRRYGKDAQVVRMPEKNACSACLRVFMRGGEPITWNVQELLQNGTNVGLPRSQWKPTLWPVHPQCRCGTIVISPFMEYKNGELRAKRPT